MKNIMDGKANLFIVGAEKAGTTSIYDYLSQQKDIFMSPIKEPNYFSSDLSFDEINRIDIESYLSTKALEMKHIAHVQDLSQYTQLFRNVENEKLIGESSVSYLYSEVAAQNIYNYEPTAKIIISLRDPIERAFSEYKMDLAIGRINDDFKDALKSREGYINKGMYYEQVKRYYDIFPNENIKVILFDDLKNNPNNVIQKLFDFLDIERNKGLGLEQSNESVAPKYTFVNHLLYMTGLKRILRNAFPPEIKDIIKKIYYQKPAIHITNNEKLYLSNIFQNDVNKTAKLLDIDLSSWLK